MFVFRFTVICAPTNENNNRTGFTFTISDGDKFRISIKEVHCITLTSTLCVLSEQYFVINIPATRPIDSA